MKQEKMKILELLQSGAINAEEAAKLLQAVDTDNESSSFMEDGVSLTKVAVKKNAKRKFLKVLIDSSDGDKVNVQIPIEFAKMLKNMNLDKKMEGKDFDIDVDEIVKMIEEGADGEIVNINSSDGDIVRIVIE